MEDPVHSSVYSSAERTVHVTFCLEHVHDRLKPSEQFFSEYAHVHDRHKPSEQFFSVYAKYNL